MENDQEEFLLSAYQAKQGVESTNAILNKLTINGEEKTVDTDIVTVSGTSTGAGGNLTGKATVVEVRDVIQPSSRTPGTADISKFFQNRTGMVAAANARLLGDILYTYWEDYGQFQNKEPRKSGLYSTPAYTGERNTKVLIPLIQKIVTKERMWGEGI